MSFKKNQATAKNPEGKFQQEFGNITGDPKDQREGRAKQIDAKVYRTVAHAEDAVKKST